MTATADPVQQLPANGPPTQAPPAPPREEAPDAAAAEPPRPARAWVRRIFECRCGRPIFFRNSRCLACQRALGFVPELGRVLALEPADDDTWSTGDSPGGLADPPSLYRRCANFETAAACNWLLRTDEPGGYTLCRCCRLNRTVPDQSIERNQLLWRRVESAKRRMVSSLIALGLPVASRIGEDPVRGLAFDLLVNASASTPVMTGHNDGIITLNVDEADDATREAVRSAMHEPYRTVLGHLRHESGHYYWARLVQDTPWQEACRVLFGDEREDYGLRLQNHHANGPPADWALRHVSAYASAHPWEDWAETWAHYLHMIDSLETALSAGLHASGLELLHDPFGEEVLSPVGGRPIDDADRDFLHFVNQWVELTGIVNELSRSMGQHDFYPFVLNVPSVAKLHFIHQLVRAEGRPPG